LERTAANRVSIIIVTHNSMPALRDCLASLEAGCAGVEWHLIVVDNLSRDKSVACVKERVPDATIVENGRNEGFAAGCNIGARRAGGDFLLFLNPDVQLDPHAVKHLIDTAAANIRVGVMGGRLRNPDDSFQPTCRKFPTVTNLLFSHGSFLGKLFRSSSRYTMPDFDAVTVVPAIGGALLMIRRGLFERLEGFDRRFFMFMEDTDLCRRAMLAGYKNLFVPTAGGTHLWGKGSQAGQVRRAILHHSSMWKYFLKHLPNGFSLVVLPALLVANLAVTIVLSGWRGLFGGAGEKKR